MSQLSLPAGAESGFRLVVWDAFGGRFTANLYGGRRDGWLVATRRGWDGVSSAAGPVSLVRPGWREFLGLVKQAGFWDLPERLPSDPDTTTDDGEWLSLAGRQAGRYHEVHRDGCGSPGLYRVMRFMTRASGLFAAPRPRHFTEGACLGDRLPADPTAPPEPPDQPG